MHIVYTRAKINIQFTWLHMYLVIEIRVRIWLAVFLKMGLFMGYGWPSHCTVKLADQNEFWSAIC